VDRHGTVARAGEPGISAIGQLDRCNPSTVRYAGLDQFLELLNGLVGRVAFDAAD